MDAQQISLATPSPSSYTDWATEAIREAIILGQLKPGDPIIIKDLAEQLGVSVTPLREGIQRLVADGLLYTISRRLYVRRLSKEDHTHLFEARLMIEPAAVEASVAASDHIAVRRIRSAYEAMEAAAADGNEVFERAHREFHREIISSCPSAYLQRFATELLASSSRYRILAIIHGSYTSSEHDQLYEACVRRDPQAAQLLARDHIVRLNDRQIKMLVERGLLGDT